MNSRLLLLMSVTILLFTSGCSSSGGGTIHNYDPGRAPVPLEKTEIIEDKTDLECAYFYFLWGRYAEVSDLLDEALEAYEKALICDPGSGWIAKKIPQILIRLNRIDEAEKQLGKYLENHPDDIAARMMLARIFIHQELYEKAIEQYNHIYDKQPLAPQSLLLLSELYLSLHRIDEARQTLEKLISIAPDPYPGHILLARLFFYEKKFEKAVKHYKAALEINWSPRLELELGEVYLEKNKYAEAEKIYKRLLFKDITDEKAAIALINVYLVQGKVQKAHKELTRLRGISTDLQQLELSIAIIYTRQEQFNKAIEILTELLLREDSSRARYMLGIVFVRQNRYAEALAQLEQISYEANEYESAVLLQVQILNLLQRSEEGILILNEVLSADERQFAGMLILLANMHEQQGDNRAGEDIFNRAVTMHPENDELLYEFGLFLYRQGKIMEAMAMMKDVIDLNPDHAGALNFVGYTWADRNENLEKALKYIKRAVSLQPENGHIRDSLGWVYYRLGFFDKAINELEKALQLAPDNPEILEHLGEVYIESGLREKGLGAYRRSVHFFVEDKDKQRVLKKIRIIEE